MKSFFYTGIFAVCALSAANAQSLYSLVSPVGLDESIPLSYRTNLSLGYDDNVNAVPKSYASHEEAAFLKFSVGATGSNWDARTQYSFDIQIGGIFYLESMSFGTQDVMSDISLRGTLVHNCDSTLRYSASAGVSYMPEPDYSSGINVGSRAGEYFYGYFDNSISKAWDGRFSTTTGFNFASLVYNDSIAKIDNRNYYRFWQGARYKMDPRSAVSLTWKIEYADRRFGTDALSNFVYAGYEYALTKDTNVSFSLGPQFKYTSNTGTDASVFATAALDHKLTDRSTVGFFFRREDESTNTYQAGYNYGTNIAYRTGLSGSYKLNHVFTLAGSLNYINYAYRQGQGVLPNKDSNTWNATVGLSYAATRNLSFRLGYSYTHAKNGGFIGSNKYSRNIYSISAGYQF